MSGAVTMAVCRPGGDPALPPGYHWVMPLEPGQTQDKRVVHRWQDQELKFLLVVAAHHHLDRVGDAGDHAIPH